jgi:phytoene dehydrogenase-like protein
MTSDVLVVGGGAAGLTAAAYGARAGRSVALFERQARLGGLVQSVNRDGFVFDMGLRAVENAGIVLPMLEELGLHLEHVRSPVSVGIEDRMIRVDAKASLADYRDLLVRTYPDRAADVDRIMALITRIMKDMDVLYGIDNPLFKDVLRDRRYLFGTLLPWMFRFVATIGRINRMSGPVERLLDELTDDPGLKGIIGQHFFKGTPAFFAMSYFSVYLDYLYPRGGTAALMGLLEGYVRDHGVEVRTELPIVAVDPEARTVTDRDGAVHGYRTLIWCGDLKALYRAIDDGAIADPRLARAVGARRDELEGCSGSDSVLSLFLSVDEPPATFAAISEGHLFYAPDARGLGDLHTRGLEALLARHAGGPLPEAPVKAYLGAFFARTTYEVSIPVLKDPALAPAGKTGVIVSCLFDYRLTRRIQEAGWTDAFREHAADAMTAVLAERLYPGLAAKVVSRFMTTPVTLEARTGNSDGAIVGWAFDGAHMPAVHQMQRVARSVLTPIPGVLQAGQWAYSPGGVPMAFLTGKLAAERAVKGTPRRRTRSPLVAR